MPNFSLTAPSISTPITGVTDRLQGKAARFRQDDFLNAIIDSINKSAKEASKKVGKISDTSDTLSFLNKLASFIPGYAGVSPFVEGLIGIGETHFTDKAMKGAERGIDKQVSRGYLSSTLPEYLEQFKQGRKDRRKSNIMDALTRTALSGYGAYKGGAYDNVKSNINRLLGNTDIVTKPTGAAAMSGEDLYNMFNKPQADRLPLGQMLSTKQMLPMNQPSLLNTFTEGLKDPRMQTPMNVLESILQRGTSPQVSSPYANLGIRG